MLWTTLSLCLILVGNSKCLIRSKPLATQVEESSGRRSKTTKLLNYIGLRKPVWLPPRGRHPCRKVVIEILTRYCFQTHTTPKQKSLLDINIDRLAENRIWDKKYVEGFYPVCDPTVRLWLID